MAACVCTEAKEMPLCILGFEKRTVMSYIMGWSMIHQKNNVAALWSEIYNIFDAFATYVFNHLDVIFMLDCC